MKIVTTCLFAVLLCSCQQAVDNRTSERPEVTKERREEVRRIIAGDFHFDIDIVRGPLTVREVQKELAEAGRRPAEVPGWREIKAKFRRGDEIYFYKTDRQSWAELRGREGYVAIRGIKIVDFALTRMN